MLPHVRLRSWLYRARLRRAFDKAHSEGARTARPGRHPFVVVLDHPEPFRNPARIVRSADAFGARAVYVVGTGFFDPLPSGGTLRSVPVRLFAHLRDAYDELLREGYALFGLDVGSKLGAPAVLHRLELPEKSAFVIGNERRGLSFSASEFPRVTPVVIPQYGVAPCLTSAMAATIAMYEYARQRGGTTEPMLGRLLDVKGEAGPS